MGVVCTKTEVIRDTADESPPELCSTSVKKTKRDAFCGGSRARSEQLLSSPAGPEVPSMRTRAAKTPAPCRPGEFYAGFRRRYGPGTGV